MLATDYKGNLRHMLIGMGVYIDILRECRELSVNS